MASDSETRTAPAYDLTKILLADASADAILDVIVSTAQRSVSSAGGAGVSLIRDGVVSTVAYSNELVREVDAVQYETGEGPCLMAIRENHVVHAPDLVQDPRWDAFRAGAIAKGVLGVLSIPLEVRSSALGALNLYSLERGAFDERDREVATSLGEQASVVIANAQIYFETARANENLREAMRTRDLIGQAKGIVMERQRCSEEEAFDVLRRVSQEKNIKLRDVAQQFVDSVGGGGDDG